MIAVSRVLKSKYSVGNVEDPISIIRFAIERIRARSSVWTPVHLELDSVRLYALEYDGNNEPRINASPPPCRARVKRFRNLGNPT